MLELEYSIDKPGAIEGIITIRNEDYDLFETFDDNREIKIRSIEKDGRIKFYSDNLVLDTAGGHNLEVTVSNAFFKVHFYEMTKLYTTGTHTFFLEKFTKPFNLEFTNKERLVRFLITGPYGIWKDLFYNGEYKLTYENYLIEVFAGNIYEQEFGVHEEIQLTKKRYFIQVSEISVTQTTNDRFIEGTINLMENFLTFSSFLSDQSITWWNYTFIKQKNIIDYTRRLNSENFYFGEYSQLLFDSGTCKNILQNKLSKFISTNIDYLDIKTPILEFLSKKDVKYLPQRFTIVYIALETLCNNFAKKENIREIIKDGRTLKSIRKLLNETIHSLNVSDPEKEQIIQKLPELNNAPMKLLYETFFNKFNLLLNDKHYTEDKSNLSFLRIRNKLLHGDGKKVNNMDLHNAVKDIEFFFINIVLKILGIEQFYKRNYFHF